MSKKIRPSIIAQRTFSLLTGPRKHPQRYSFIDARTVARPVGIGAAHVHARAIAQANARVRTTIEVIEGSQFLPDMVVETGTDVIRPNSLEAWANSILKGEF